MQHRQEDRHAVYVDGNRDDNNAKHRQEHGHDVHVKTKKDIDSEELGQSTYDNLPDIAG